MSEYVSDFQYPCEDLLAEVKQSISENPRKGSLTYKSIERDGLLAVATRNCPDVEWTYKAYVQVV